MGQVASSLASGMKQTMDENFKRQMEFQLNSFQMQLERQLAMQVCLQLNSYYIDSVFIVMLIRCIYN